ncbi:MAG: glycosyltransferase family 2 protein [Deltaproteobacteria bacterium]|nr:glycosyltransferase family 2 protein [Deltaproteobacteria bacterium]
MALTGCKGPRGETAWTAGAQHRAQVRHQAPRVLVLIATAYGRTQWLVDRALRSVYGQADCDLRLVHVLIVDDNEPVAGDSASGRLAAIQGAVIRLRESQGLVDDAFPTGVIANERTHGHSGSGAWNTGIEHFAAAADAGRSFIALLDDDDEWLPGYLTACVEAVTPRTVAVFAHLEWVDEHGSSPKRFTADDLTPEAFFVGDPGVQGSNMFIATRLLARIGGFDEAFTGSCDRELMIRLLDALRPGEEIVVVPQALVRHHHHRGPSVTTDLAAKHRGLDRLYALYGARFSDGARQASLRRALHLFGYRPRSDAGGSP